MGLFFLTALVTFVVARFLRSWLWWSARVPDWAAPWVVGSAILALMFILGLVQIIALWQAVGAGLGESWVEAAMPSLASPETVLVIGGMLAGVILHEGLRLTPPIPTTNEELAVVQDDVWRFVSGSRRAAHAAVAAALFVAVAFAAQPGVLARLRSVDAGGFKIELLPGDGAPAVTPFGRERQIVGPALSPFPNLALLRHLVQPDDDGLLARDIATIEKLHAPGRTPNPAIRWMLKVHADFLLELKWHLDCVDAYVVATGDRRLVSTRGVDAALHFTRLERMMREAADARPVPPSLHKIAAAFFDGLVKVSAEAQAHLLVGMAHADAVGTIPGCLDQPLPTGNPTRATREASLDRLWQLQAEQAPYLTLAAAWMASIYQDREFAIRMLFEWIERHEPADGAGAPRDPGAAWFRVRAWAHAANILHEMRNGGMESLSAKTVLKQTIAAIDALPGLPPLSTYARDKVDRRPERCPGLHGKPADETDARILHTRLSMAIRLLNAAVDNVDVDGAVTEADLEFARRVRDVDATCIPYRFRADHRAPLEAHALLTYGRVALAWASRGAVTYLHTPALEQALRQEGAIAIRTSRNHLAALEDAWRQRLSRQSLTDRVLEPWVYLSELSQARHLAGELRQRRQP